MSGIVAVLNVDGAPVDPGVLDRMTAALRFRGPDAQRRWRGDGDAGLGRAVGLGHALLRTTWESARERQPASLDGRVWVTADARVDGRRELIRTLRAKGRDVAEAAPDVELLLHAYHVWELECVEHL